MPGLNVVASCVCSTLMLTDSEPKSLSLTRVAAALAIMLSVSIANLLATRPPAHAASADVDRSTAGRYQIATPVLHCATVTGAIDRGPAAGSATVTGAIGRLPRLGQVAQ